jgi:hypothetical protein
VSAEHTITKKAVNGELTIGELRQFLADFDKATADVVDPAGRLEALTPSARSKMNGRLKSITVVIPGE